MTVSFRFWCSTCEEEHVGIPAWGWDDPLGYFMVPEQEREERCFLTSDLCVVDDEAFYIRGCLEIPINGTDDLLSLGVWVSVSESAFMEYQDLLGAQTRSSHGPYTGRLEAAISTYSDTGDLMVSLQVRDKSIRPLIQLEPSDHPLYLEQNEGASDQRVVALYDHFMHPRAAV
ncbi:MAG: DUF2199 domain-containing protein [Dokdonella sp.]|uniref:DUF2199 domain-containing protein n=1 Tax=Dokdonella sp. TaxID=2291710 RepID=UPI003F80DCBC